MLFGIFSNQWAWRVEWRDAAGKLHTKDFPQRDLHPGEAKAAADLFRAGLNTSLAA
jgi:hypothetical protein